MKQRELLISLENLLDTYQDKFIQIRDLIVEQQVSNYPIFVFQKPSINILGTKLIDESSHPEKWNVYVTHLEELYNKKIVNDEKLEEFQFNYKEKNDQFCILCIYDQDNYEFVYSPIQE